METFIVLGFCFILYEALDFFQSCYTNNNLHEQQHPQFSKDISSDRSKATAALTTAPTTAQPSSSTVASAEFTLHANQCNENRSSPYTGSITTIPLSDTHIVENSDLDLIAVSSNHLNCVDSEFGAGAGEFDESIHEINVDNDDYDVEDNSDENSDSDIKTIQSSQSSSYRLSGGSGANRHIYSICDRVNHFNRRSELLIDYHCSSAISSQNNHNIQ